MTPLTLESFCGARPPFHRPASFGGHHYASDGRVLVRIPRTAGHSFPPGVDTPDYAATWASWPRPFAGWEPLHPLPSAITRWVCRCCRQEVPAALGNPGNPHAEEVPVAQAIAIGPGHFSSLYLRRFFEAGLSNLEAVSLGPGQPLLLRWTGGEAILAPFKPEA